MKTPWGDSDYQKEIVLGGETIGHEVMTPSHGGLMLNKSWCLENLPEKALKTFTGEFQNFICFEEDCDFGIPLWESDELREFFIKRDGERWYTEEKLRANLRRYLTNQ